MSVLGDRVDAAIRAENFGLCSQREAAIRARVPRYGWVPEFEDGNPMPVRLRWCGLGAMA